MKSLFAGVNVLLVVMLGAVATGAPVSTLPAQEFGVDRIYGTSMYTVRQAPVTWSADGRHFITSRRNGRSLDLYKVDAVTGDSTLWVAGGRLIPEGDDQPITVDSYSLAPDESKLLLLTDSRQVFRRSRVGRFYVWDLVHQKLTRVGTGEAQMLAKFSPDGRLVGYVEGNNIHVFDLQTLKDLQITNDGSNNIINGRTDWVYEEELSLVDAFRFSPDGRLILFLRFDQSPIKQFFLLDELQLYPALTPIRYPKAGTANSKVTMAMADVTSGRIQSIDLDVPHDGYVAQFGFHGDDEIWYTTLNRHQNELNVVIAGIDSGDTRVVMTDRDSAWVDARTPIWIDGGKRFLYLSERDGFAHIYSFTATGGAPRQLTKGKWDVLNIYGVDEVRKVVYFSSSMDGPAERPLYRVGLDGSHLTRVSLESGTHRVAFSPDYKLYVDSHSAIGIPPVQAVRDSEGKVVRVLEDNRAVRRNIEQLGIDPPEFIKIPTSGGVELNAYILKPRGFDPDKQYPLLMYVYGGPGSQTVLDSWGGSRYLWHLSLAFDGYIVASVDNRGTGARGAAFKKLTYLNLGKYESEDQIAAARYLGSLPYVDESRIGIWGWSYGGYMAALSKFKGKNVFKAAISVAPVTDWRFYDTIYTERYMQTPQENPDGYRSSAPLNYADQLEGNYLVVHGTGDDNVHPQNTIQLVDRLEKTNKQFDMRVYPNKTHSIGGRTIRWNLFGYLSSWLRKNLYEGGSITKPVP